MLGVALKGVPRESYQLMSKITTRGDVDPQEKIDELRRLAQTEYFDIMLLHWQHSATWPTDSARWQDGIEQAQMKKRCYPWGFRPWAAGAATGAGGQLAGGGDDPGEP